MLGKHITVNHKAVILSFSSTFFADVKFHSEQGEVFRKTLLLGTAMDSEDQRGSLTHQR